MTGVRHQGSGGICRPSKILLVLVILVALLSFIDGVHAATLESAGPREGFGWIQLYYGSTPNFKRLTGSSDREYYDYGFKQIQIYGRQEDYWSQDSGWWYVADPSLSSIRILDNSSGEVYYNTSLGTLVKGTTYITYIWGSNTSGTEKPGRWTVDVNDGTESAIFYIYVRGQLNVTSISNSPSPVAGSSVEINATVKDHAGNTVSSSAVDKPSLTMYVSGAGFYNESDMTAGASDWTASFTPSAPGDYYITIKAGDGHTYWVDGRGSLKIPVGGAFPTSVGGSGGAILKVLLMILLALIIVESNSILKLYGTKDR